MNSISPSHSAFSALSIQPPRSAFDILIDTSSTDRHKADALINIFHKKAQSQLNTQLKELKPYSYWWLNEHVCRMLAEQYLQIQTNLDGTIAMLRGLRSDVAGKALHPFLPPALSDIVKSYVNNIEFCEENDDGMIEIFKSRNGKAKSMAIWCASSQGAIDYLNHLFDRVRPLTSDRMLVLSWTDLSELDLTGIDLSETRLYNAKLDKTILAKVRLGNSSFLNVSLHDAILDGASRRNSGQIYFEHADLTGASLIDADLENSVWDSVTFKKTNLTRSILTDAHFHRSRFHEMTLDHTNLSNVSMEEVTIQDSSMMQLTLDERGYESLLQQEFIGKVPISSSSEGGRFDAALKDKARAVKQ